MKKKETLCENFYNGKVKTTKWYKFEIKNLSKIKKINIVKEAIGLQQCVKDIDNELHAFSQKLLTFCVDILFFL